MSANCPLCNSEVPEEKGPIILDERGLPRAASLCGGLPVPRVSQPLLLKVFLNGEPVDSCVAYDRDAGLVWRYLKSESGLLRRDGEFVIEKVAGLVTVEPME